MECSNKIKIEAKPAVIQCVQLEEMASVEEISFAEATIIDEPQICSARIQEICSATETTVNPLAVHSIRSPQSPLSMMDLITLGSPVELTSTDGSPNGTTPQECLEIPTPERLLSVGPEKDCDQVKKADEQSGGSLLERVWQVVGGWANGNKHNSMRDCELDEVVVTGENNKPTKIKAIDPSMRNNDAAQINSNTSTEDNTDETTTTSNSGPTDTCPGKFSRQRKAGIPTQADNQYEEDEDDQKNDFDWDDHGDVSGIQQSDMQAPPPPSIKQSSLRVGEDCMSYRCMECGETLEEFSNDDLGMCIIILSTFVYRQPGLAAPLLPRMLKTVARVSGSEIFSWQYESAVHLPGSATSIGRQFLRCVLHQLAPNQIFNQIFQTKIEEGQRLQLFRTLAQALTDFNELNPSAPIQILLENLNGRKVLPADNIPHILGNVASYMECVTQEGGGGLNSSLVPLFDTFLRKLLLCVTGMQELNPILRVLVAILRIPGVSSHKGVLDPVSKLLSFIIQNSPLQYQYLNDICYLCNRIFSRERDKLLLTRLVVYELVQALKFKTSIPDTNLILLVQMIVQDGGGTLGTNSVVEDLPKDPSEIGSFPNTCASECMRAHVNDALEFIADVHTLTKVKSNCHKNVGLNEDTMGGLVKAGISQYLAMELARRSSQDHRTLGKYLPWLNSPPTAVQQGPKEFIDCVAHIRLLSWILLGALSHMCMVPGSVCQPVPPESSCHIADHIQVILTGFAEQSKQSVLHMSSLFHAFILCQLWTVYLEQSAGSPGNDNYGSISSILTDFWAKVTPGILQLVSHSKVLGDMVNLHFASLMEALHECQSTVLSKLLPLWAPVLFTHHKQLPSQLSVRLQACQNAAPPVITEESMKNAVPNNLLRWLHRLQFKMGQIELQSSQAFQIYTV
ncbi:unnamed protein product [Meganyctiphanes norvegica]|uniref:Protein unc-79 homolog n=1 Tax=Meganyctiphanes norvegica TaxID=48144 RepID=A0AAV2R8Z3_MEGNR